MTKIVWVFIAILASSCEASTENESLLSKIERLEVENARLMQLKAENFQLKAEITRLQRKEMVDKDALSEIQTATSKQPKMCPAHKNSLAGGHTPETVRRHHCKGRCELDLDFVNKQCLITDKLVKYTKQRLEVVEKSPHPTWNIRMFQFNDKVESMGTIDCPCSDKNGKLLTVDAAQHRILSQIAILDVHSLAEYMAQTWQSDPESGKRQLLRSNVLIAYAAGAMVKCWVEQCIGHDEKDQQTTSDELLRLLELEHSNELTTGSWNGC
jgi:hypothetical protein